MIPNGTVRFREWSSLTRVAALLAVDLSLADAVERLINVLERVDLNGLDPLLGLQNGVEWLLPNYI